MKALIYTAPHRLEFTETAEPIANAGEIMVKVDSVGICGSDMHAFLGHDDRRPAPLILGHEVAGMTEHGQRVTINPLVTCGGCQFCTSGQDNLCQHRQIISMPPREGGFAERLAMPAANLTSVPDHVPLNKAALTEPLACGWHAVRLGKSALRYDPDKARLLIIGGGAIGVGAALCSRAQGFNDITLVEPNPIRAEYLAKVDGFNILHPDNVYDMADFDLLINGVGFESTRALASASARPGGVILHIGLGSASGGIDVRRLTLQEITFIGTYTYTEEDFNNTAEALFDGRLGNLDWLEERPLAEGQNAFTDIKEGQTAAPKIILKP
ncbi:MAG: alcohol dehydrogenase catalytic domain-containing protein [Alphaproteobacteria bacterium]|nr:alcohol dehydrogenase catalytic domain-containing protein [Alphaproteobacteria bacterium]